MGVILKKPSYVDQFGLSEDPFNIIPSERFMYLKSSGHNNALALIDRVIDRRSGLALIIGEAGTGKTTMMRRIESALLNEPGYKVGVISVPGKGLTYFQLLEEIINSLGYTCRGQTKKARGDQLRSALLDLYEKGITPIFLLDEAQDLEAKVLEDIRSITNFEHPEAGRMLQIIFFAMPKINNKLPYAKSLASRLKYSRTTLPPMNPVETSDMLRWRFEVAGGKQFPLSGEVLTEIHEIAGGIPRYSCALTQLAFEVLATGQKVTPDTIREIHNSISENK